MVRFSLILPTVGRTEAPRLFLDSLDAQTYRDFELIVVDQNPDDRLELLLASYSDRFPITHLRTEMRGVSRARNLGMKYANGEMYAFPDDDCQYPPELLGRVAEIFEGRRQIDGLSGRSIDDAGGTSNGRFDTEPGPVDRLNAWLRGIEYTLFLRSGSVPKVRFDEALGVGAGTAWGAGEGIDYMMRLLDEGMCLYYDPEITVVHHPSVPPYSAEAARKAYSYGIGMSHVLLRHRMPLGFRTMWFVRPLAGTLLSVLGLHAPKARHHWYVFKGRLKGLQS